MDMRTSKLARLERRIREADGGGIIERWRWGRAVLADPLRTAESGKSLKHGVMTQLLTQAREAGGKISEREIQRRLACARTYRTETEIRQAMADFGYWAHLAEANFPPVAATTETTDVTPLDPAARDAVLTIIGESTDPKHWEQMLLGSDAAPDIFPATLRIGRGRKVPLGEATIGDAVAWNEQSKTMTARFMTANQRRDEWIAILLAATGGDRTVRYADAVARVQTIAA
jgi:hypothetical protein